MARKNRKRELYDLVLALWDHGLRSPTLIAELLGISKAYACQILLLHNRRHTPRHGRDDTLAGLPPALRSSVMRFLTPDEPGTEPTFDSSQAKDHGAA